MPNPYSPPSSDLAAPPSFTGERLPGPPEVIRYRYVPRLVPMLLVTVFFGACLVFYVHRAQSNDRGLIINGLIELGPSGATRFYACFAVACASFTLVGVWALLTRLRGPSYLTLEEHALSIPSRFGRRATVIPYAAISDLKLVSFNRQSSLTLTTTTGKAAIAGIMLASDEQLREVGALISQRRSGSSR